MFPSVQADHSRTKLPAAWHRQRSVIYGLLSLFLLPALGTAFLDRFQGWDQLFAAAAVAMALLVVALSVDWILQRRARALGVADKRMRWSEMVGAAMEHRNTSQRSVVGRLGIGYVHWWAWRRGYRDPDPRVQRRLADELHLSPYELMEAAGYLPSGTEAALVSNDRERQAAGLDLVRAMNADTDPWPTTVVPVGRGMRHRVSVFHEYVAFTGPTSGLDGVTRDDARRRLESRLGHAWQASAAAWEDSDELIREHLGVLDPSAALERTQVALVPRFLASANRLGAVDPMHPPLIAVLGGHHSGAPDAAAELARQLGYSYDLLSNRAVQCYGRRPAAERAFFESRLARLLMDAAPLSAGGRVWAFNDVAAIRSFDVPAAIDRGVAVAVVRRSTKLVQYNAVRGYLHHRDREAASADALATHIRRQQRFDEELAAAAAAVKGSRLMFEVEVDVPSDLRGMMPRPTASDEELLEQCPDCVDEFFDLYIDAGRKLAHDVSQR